MPKTINAQLVTAATPAEDDMSEAAYQGAVAAVKATGKYFKAATRDDELKKRIEAVIRNALDHY